MTILHRLSCFHVLPSEKLLELGQSCLRKQFNKGSFLYKPGDSPDHVFIVEKGKFLAYRLTSCGKPCVSRTLYKEEFAGEEDIFLGTARDSYVESLTDSQCILIPKTVYEDMLTRYPELARTRLEELSNRLKETEQMMQAIAYSSVSQRLLLLLSEIGKQKGGNNEHEMIFHLDVSHQDLAAMIGSTRETVTSNLSSLQRKGVITVTDKHIRIKKEKLAHYL